MRIGVVCGELAMDGTTNQAGVAAPRRASPLRIVSDALFRGDVSGLGDRQVLDALAAAVYVTDAAGRITYYNEAAVALWGHRPALGQAQWCGSWKLYWPDGSPLPHAECPMAVSLREGRPVRGLEAVAERPDGTRVPFIPYPTPLFDASGALVGAVNMLVDITERRETEQRLRESEARCRAIAAIVESSDDAIISKDLNSIIKSWNQ